MLKMDGVATGGTKPEKGAWPELEPMPRLKYKFGRKIARLRHTRLNKPKMK
jgi:hypothetical protein